MVIEIKIYYSNWKFAGYSKMKIYSFWSVNFPQPKPYHTFFQTSNLKHKSANKFLFIPSEACLWIQDLQTNKTNHSFSEAAFIPKPFQTSKIQSKFDFKTLKPKKMPEDSMLN